MALQGTIDSFPVVDVLGLLSASAKTGCLELTGDRGRGTLWLREGMIVDGGVDGHPTTGAAEVVFELLLFENASFEFVVGEPGCSALVEVSVSEAVEQAEQMLGAWQQVRDVVPDFSMRVAIVAEIDGDEVTLGAAEWALVACCAGQPSVGGILVELGLGEFDGCSRLADLVQRGLLAVSEADSSPSVPEGTEEPSLVPDEVVPPAAFEDDGARAADAAVATDRVATDRVATEHGAPLSERPVQTAPKSGIFGMAPDTDFADDDQTIWADTHEGASGGSVFDAEAPGARCGDAQQHHADVSEGFPEHFPIDDLVGSGDGGAFDMHFSDEPRPGGPAFSETEVDSQPGDPLASTESVDPAPPDDVLAQIGRLSPKAAEAIAAALGDGDDG